MYRGSTRHVARRRHRVLGADEALAQGMVDGVATLADVVRRMQKDARAAKAERTQRAQSRSLVRVQLGMAAL
jgi:hypothetical protein